MSKKGKNFALLTQNLGIEQHEPAVETPLYKVLQSAEKLGVRCPAHKGASDFEELTASLKRCPDTKREFFSKLISR